MSDKIQIMNGEKDGYTAKEAMQHVVEYVNAKSTHAIEVLSIGESKEDGAESVLFVKMCMRFLHKNSKKVFIIAKNDEMLQKLREYIVETYERIQIVETVNWDENAMSHDMVLNQINGDEAECVIAAIPFDEQNDFLEQYRSALDAKIWIGIGTELKAKKGKIILDKIRGFFQG